MKQKRINELTPIPMTFGYELMGELVLLTLPSTNQTPQNQSMTVL